MFSPEKHCSVLFLRFILLISLIWYFTFFYILHIGLLIVFENDRFLFCFSNVFKNDLFFFGKNERFQKRPTHFELLENEWRLFFKTIVFIKTISDRFLYDCFFF